MPFETEFDTPLVYKHIDIAFVTYGNVLPAREILEVHGAGLLGDTVHFNCPKQDVAYTFCFRLTPEEQKRKDVKHASFVADYIASDGERVREGLVTLRSGSQFFTAKLHAQPSKGEVCDTYELLCTDENGKLTGEVYLTIKMWNPDHHYF